jgi:ParB family transcriptional regulator, chromosome partitioning protein
MSDRTITESYKMMRIADIKVGERYRRDHGDIAGLAQSIAAIGLLHPITIDADGNLLAGARRLAACKHLGWSEIPVRIVVVLS